MRREKIQSVVFKDLTLLDGKGQPVFSNINFKMPLNQIVWLRDKNGIGKSALVKLICGLLMPSSGDYLINNQTVNEMTFEEFMPFRCNMGYSFDFGGLIHNRDIMSNLMFANEYHGSSHGTSDELAARVSKYISDFQLNSVVYERPSSLAGHQRKAACVVRAFMHEPEMLLLDDPTTGLRQEVKVKLRETLLEKMKSGGLKHVFIATDDVSFMKSLNPIILDVSENKIAHEEKGAA